jgi:hypothetical protein
MFKVILKKNKNYLEIEILILLLQSQSELKHRLEEGD